MKIYPKKIYSITWRPSNMFEHRIWVFFKISAFKESLNSSFLCLYSVYSTGILYTDFPSFFPVHKKSSLMLRSQKLGKQIMVSDRKYKCSKLQTRWKVLGENSRKD